MSNITYHLHTANYRINSFIGEIGRNLVRFSQRNSNYVKHAKREWKFTFPYQDEMQDAIGENIIDVISMFGLEGHSGFSASYTRKYIALALKFEPFSPLTGEDDEWMDVAKYSNDDICYQNIRCSHVFKDSDGAYDCNGRVFIDPDGCSFTSKDSRVQVTFPYSPKTEYVYLTPEEMEARN